VCVVRVAGLLFLLMLHPRAADGEQAGDTPSLVEQTIAAIERCLAAKPAPWPDEWRHE
jgi:hypothetical protein